MKNPSPRWSSNRVRAILAEGSRSRISASSVLRAIGDERVRNLMRGILAANDENAAKRTMERLRRESGGADAAIAFGLLRQLDRTHLLAPVPDFPAKPEEVDKAPFYGTAPLSIELLQQGLRLQAEVERLIAAIALIGELNACILDGDHEGTAVAFLRYGQEFGLSLLVGQKAISLRHAGSGGREKRVDHGDVIAPFLSPRRQIVAVAFEDSVDDDRDYMRVRRTFLRFAAKDQLDRQDATIISDLFGPRTEREGVLAQRLQAYSRWGLVDAIAFIFRMRRLFELQDNVHGTALIDAAVPEKVTAAWRRAFGPIEPEQLRARIATTDQFFERSLFAHLPAWSEYDDLFDYRVRMEQAIGARLDGVIPVAARTAHLVATPTRHVEDLLAQEEGRFSLDRIDPRSCGAFHRTASLIASLEAKTLEQPEGHKLCSLLDETIDVASMLSLEELNLLMPPKLGDRLHCFLRAAVLKDFEDGKVSGHALRRSLQDLVRTGFDGDIVALLEHVDTDRHHVSKHLYNLCSEPFLTELYDLFEQTDQVTEAHAAILEWWGERADDEDARLRAKSHRLSLRLRKVRGAIEETRIYVDPLRFIAWMQDESSAELRTLAVKADLILADTDQSVNLKDRVRLAVQPRMRLLALLDSCYEEFCTNKLYGVTSFIGRRIRHGTLHGHLVLEFKPMVARAISDFGVRAPVLAEFLESWLNRFDAAVQTMAADSIHVRSKEKSRGLIIATLDEPDKHRIANRMVEEVARSLLDRPQIALSAALIHEYCWLLFEIDLVRTREAVEGLRRDFLINVEDHLTDRPDLDRRIGDRIRSLNSALQQRFEIVRSWFTRPTNQSPSASVRLLFEAVLGEVRQRFPSFKPRLDYTGDSDVDLIGHRFHFFYDALFLLVGNAAKHGRGDGMLGMHIAASFEEQRYTYLSVSVRSDFIPASRERDVANIEQAMADTLGDAVLKNQNSGIRKLREMVEDVEEIVGLHRRYEGEGVIFTIDMRYTRS